MHGSITNTFKDAAAQAVAGIKRPKKPSAGIDLARHLTNAKAIMPKLLIQTLHQGEIQLFEALLSKLGEIPVRLAQRMTFESDGEALAVACRAFGIFNPDFASTFLLSRKARPSDKIVDPNELSRAFDIYDRTDIALAAKIVRRWQRDPKYLDAVANLSLPPEIRKAAQ